MESNQLKELLVEHKTFFLKPVDLIEREFLISLEKIIDQREIIIITGIRRCGKSSLLQLIAKWLINFRRVPVNNILYLNFDDERFIDFTVSDFDHILELFAELEQPDGKLYLFLDEIQNIYGWERWVNRLYEFENVKILITGSNASLLSSEISTLLTGRNRQIELFPFSFREFLSFYDLLPEAGKILLREKRSQIKSAFNNYLEVGGFPEVIKQKDVTILAQYFKDIIYRDIASRYHIRNDKEIVQLCIYLASNVGSICSYNKLRSLIGVKSINTVKQYLAYLENAYLFFTVDLFDYSIKKQLYNPSKIYSMDTGLTDSIAFKFSKNIGHYYENMVALELKRQKIEFYYWRDGKSEVDIVTRQGLRPDRAIQVCWDITDHDTYRRELNGFYRIHKALGVKKYLLITENTERTVSEDGFEVHLKPLWKWLITRD